MKIKVASVSNASLNPLSGRCPHCGKTSVLQLIGQDLGLASGIFTGQRMCPDPACKGHMFIISNGSAVLTSYPRMRAEFDSTNIPPAVLKTFEEALDCHAAGAFVAAAIMVRRTLEEICVKQGVTGSNLQARLKNLGSKIVMPKELLEGMDELRLLGNDAAHIEAKTYNAVSRSELDVAIEVAKEILKALYQYSALLGKLRALKAES